MALPLLPGNSFNRNLGKEKYHKSHYFDSKNDINFMFGDDKIGIGGDPLPGQRIEAPTSNYPAGLGSKVPAWIAFDKQVLFFDAFFQESVNERREEQSRVRHCKIIFYLEDDTIQVIEPRSRNSCLPQGTIIRRHRIPKPAPNDHLFYTVHDLNVGIDIEFYRKIFRIISCDEFTHNFLRKLGVKIGQPEQLPMDNYNLTRKAMEESMQPLRPYERKDKLKQFLDHDRHVLRFFCHWDDTDTMYGDQREMILHYFLADDTVEIREIIPPNAGRDAAPTFLKRQKLPKYLEPLAKIGTQTDRTLLNVLGHPQRGGRYLLDNLKTGEVKVEYYNDADFQIGASVNVFGRKFIITDMDTFTKEFYNAKYGLGHFMPISHEVYRGEPIIRHDPPFNGWGSEEDSLGNCHGLMPQPPKRDFIKFMEKDRQGLESHVLRFKARLVTDKFIDKDRRFIISYFLSDDSMLVFETVQKNSGFLGGKFLERCKIKKPGQERYSTELPKYYQASDIYVGAIVEINNFNFLIEDADEYAYRYMEKNYIEFPMSNIDRIVIKLRQKFAANEREIECLFKDNDVSKKMSISFHQLHSILRSRFAIQELSDQEICTIARYYASRPTIEVNVPALIGIAQQYLRKANFEEFSQMKIHFAKSDKSGSGCLSRMEMKIICQLFHMPLTKDLLHALFDQCQANATCDLINYDHFLHLINWRSNAHPAPTSDIDLSGGSGELLKGKCVEEINYSQLLADLIEA